MRTFPFGPFTRLAQRRALRRRLGRDRLGQLQHWLDGHDDSATRALEAGLFFDPTLLRSARLLLRLQLRRMLRPAALVCLLAGLLLSTATLAADGSSTTTSTTSTTSSDPGSAEDTVWQWLTDLLTTSGDGGGSVDPETGEG